MPCEAWTRVTDLPFRRHALALALEADRIRLGDNVKGAVSRLKGAAAGLDAEDACYALEVALAQLETFERLRPRPLNK